MSPTPFLLNLISDPEVRLVAELTDSDCNPLSGKQVNFYYRKSGESTWTLIDTVKTDSSGKASVALQLESGKYDFRAWFPGDSEYEPSEAIVKNVNVTPGIQPPSKLTCNITADKTLVHPGDTVNVTVNVSFDREVPSDTDVKVTLSYVYQGVEHEIRTKTITVKSGNKSESATFVWTVPDLGLKEGERATVTLVVDVESPSYNLSTSCSKSITYEQPKKKEANVALMILIAIILLALIVAFMSR